MPALGQQLFYVLRQLDVEEIEARRAQSYAAAIAAPVVGVARGGTDVHEGDVYPATVVRCHQLDPEALVSLRVLLDGTDDLWARQRPEGTAHEPGTWHWPDM